MSWEDLLKDALEGKISDWKTFFQDQELYKKPLLEITGMRFDKQLDLSYFKLPPAIRFIRCVIPALQFTPQGMQTYVFEQCHLGRTRIRGESDDKVIRSAYFDECSFTQDLVVSGYVKLSISRAKTAIALQTEGTPDAPFSGSLNVSNSKVALLKWAPKVTATLRFNDCEFIRSAMVLPDGPIELSPETTISGAIHLTNCTVAQGRLFENVDFRGETNFRSTTFATAPSFHGATLHQSTAFDDVSNFDRQFPDTVSDDAERRYRTLKLAMASQGAIAEQLAFGRLELRSRQASEGRLRKIPYVLYGLSSDYGLDIVRPIAGLVVLTLVGALVLYSMGTGTEPVWNSDWWNLSLANSFPYLSATRETIDPGLIKNLIAPRYWFLAPLISVLQSITSAVLLFLIGLAIRNRLRLK